MANHGMRGGGAGIPDNPKGGGFKRCIDVILLICVILLVLIAAAVATIIIYQEFVSDKQKQPQKPEAAAVAASTSLGDNHAAAGSGEAPPSEAKLMVQLMPPSAVREMSGGVGGNVSVVPASTTSTSAPGAALWEDIGWGAAGADNVSANPSTTPGTSITSATTGQGTGDATDVIMFPVIRGRAGHRANTTRSPATPNKLTRGP